MLRVNMWHNIAYSTVITKPAHFMWDCELIAIALDQFQTEISQ